MSRKPGAWGTALRPTLTGDRFAHEMTWLCRRSLMEAVRTAPGALALHPDLYTVNREENPDEFMVKFRLRTESQELWTDMTLLIDVSELHLASVSVQEARLASLIMSTVEQAVADFAQKVLDQIPNGELLDQFG